MMWSILDITQTKNGNLSANSSDRTKNKIVVIIAQFQFSHKMYMMAKKKRNWLKPGLIFVYPMYNKYKDKHKYAFVLAYFHWFYSEFNGETTCSLLFLLVAYVVTNQIIMQQFFLGLTLKWRYATWRWTCIWHGTAQYQQGSPAEVRWNK